MSITFHVSDERPNFDADSCPVCLNGEWQTCAACNGTGFSESYRAGRATPQNYVNVSEPNAVELLRWLGYEVDPTDVSGLLPPGDLAARCRRRLARTPENVASDLPKAGRVFEGKRGCRVVSGGRRAGYLADTAERLLSLAERAGDRLVSYE